MYVAQFKKVDPDGLPTVVSPSTPLPIGSEDLFAFQFDNAGGGILYLGEAQPGSATSAALWRIMKIDTNVGVKITWADGNRLFDNIWDNRTSLSYS